jgi:hypothetical protein
MLMKKLFLFMFIGLVFAACDEDKKPKYPSWVMVPPGWEFYNGSPSEPHYIIKPAAAPLPSSIHIKYRIDGSGAYALDGGSPPTVSLILWRSLDNLSCAGPYQQYRYFGHPRMPLDPGVHEYNIPLDPASWTDCYGKPGTDFPDGFKGTVDNIWKIGFGFGGYSAGHGVVSTGAIFTLIEFNP